MRVNRIVKKLNGDLSKERPESELEDLGVGLWVECPLVMSRPPHLGPRTS